jgi:membrane protein DedA with SNARE-associated domain
MLDFISHLPPGTLYPGIFIGIIFLGGLVLLPAMYLSTTGMVNLGVLLALTLGASLFTDSFWYLVGASTKKERFYALPFIRKRVEEAKLFSEFFQKHGVFLVFIAKFVYGARIASHILAGVHKIHFLKFVMAVISGTALWFGIFYILLHSIDAGVAGVKAAANRVQLVFLVLAVLLLAINWFTGAFIRKKMMKKGPSKEIGNT